MAKDRTETGITRVAGVQDGSYLAPYVEQDTSLQGMEEYRILPRLKVVQGTSAPELKKSFPESTVLIRPGDGIVLAANSEETFDFVPHLFFVEFTKMSDRRDQDSPMVIERSFDPDSELAQRARDKDRRFEIYAGHEGKSEKERWTYRYVEHLRFPGMIYGAHPLAGTPVIMSFERGEFGQGRNFISAIKLRKMDVDGKLCPVPLWAQVWSFKTGSRSNTDGSWYGFDFTPAKNPMILPEHVDEMRGYHQELLQAHSENKIRAAEEDNDPADASQSVKETKDF